MSKVIRLPGTDRKIFVNDHIGDIVIDLGQFPEIDDSVKKEDVTVIGQWSDYTGSGGPRTSQAIYQGSQDRDPATNRAQVTGEDVEYTARGNRKSTQRQRNKLVYYKLDDE